MIAVGPGWRIFLAAFGLFSASFAILLDMAPFLGPIALWGFANAWGDAATTIKFDRPPGSMTISWYQLKVLGDWPFLKRTAIVSYENVARLRVDTNSAVVQTSPHGGYETKVYTVSLPTGDGNSIELYSQQDHEIAWHIESRLREAANRAKAS